MVRKWSTVLISLSYTIPAAVRAEFLAACHAVFELDRTVASVSCGPVAALQASCAAACAAAQASAVEPQCPGDAAWRKWAARLRCELALFGTAGSEATRTTEVIQRWESCES
jgi:hypothetical protein